MGECNHEDHEPIPHYRTPFGHIAFLIEVETGKDPDIGFAKDMFDAVDRFRKMVDTLKRMRVDDRYVKLVMLIYPLEEELTDEQMAEAERQGGIPAYGHTIQAWIGSADVASVEQFLKEETEG